MSFSIDWLDLREPADFAARDKTLVKQLLEWLGQANDPISPDRLWVDLGAGTGSTLRALTQLGAQSIVWRLVDVNGKLLDEALRRHGKALLIEDYQADLNVVEELPLTGAHVVSASALFDLVSEALSKRLIERLDASKTAFYAALNYDGRTEWTPAHAYDATVLDAFNADQRTDKGLGLALGPDATSILTEILSSIGYTVSVADSPWRLTGVHAELVTALIEGIAAAVADKDGIDVNQLADWTAFRLANAPTGSCLIGHQDILALPAKR